MAAFEAGYPSWSDGALWPLPFDPPAILAAALAADCGAAGGARGGNATAAAWCLPLAADDGPAAAGPGGAATGGAGGAEAAGGEEEEGGPAFGVLTYDRRERGEVQLRPDRFLTMFCPARPGPFLRLASQIV
jgi:hypothetical protein